MTGSVRRRTKLRVIAAGMVTFMLAVAFPTGVGKAENPCQLAATFVCQFVPILPDLDGDVDHTKQAPQSTLDVLPEPSPTTAP